MDLVEISYRYSSKYSLFSIEPFNLGRIGNIKEDTIHDESSLSKVDDDYVNKSLNFRGVPRQKSVKRYDLLCLEMCKSYLDFMECIIPLREEEK